MNVEKALGAPPGGGSVCDRAPTSRETVPLTTTTSTTSIVRAAAPRRRYVRGARPRRVRPDLCFPLLNTTRPSRIHLSTD
ncbi:hypothetical protein GCM10026982_39580 [Nocardiopsis aegyptia]